jgi:UDP-N-acetylmuramyl tripeptide synthase
MNTDSTSEKPDALDDSMNGQEGQAEQQSSLPDLPTAPLPDEKAEKPVEKRRTRSRSRLRAGVAVTSGRLAGAMSRRLHLGGGTSIAGAVAQAVYPPIVSHLAQQLHYGSLAVTGTNGKTTTSGFIAAILADSGLSVWRNREGSNLQRGIAASLVVRAEPNGRLRRSGRAVAVFELDEAVFPQVAELVKPRIAIFTNLFRDQLDRYGEVDSIATRWREMLQTGHLADATLVLNADDPAIAYLGTLTLGPVVYYGVDAPQTEMQEGEERHQARDTRTCPVCGGELVYSVRFYSHIGHYACRDCEWTRPEPQVRAVRIRTEGIDRLRVLVDSSSGARSQQELTIPLPGVYNVYNALAAIAGTQVMGVAWEPIVTGIEQFKPVFGRGERVQVEGRTLRLLLAKNPTGFNEVLRTLFSESVPRHVLFVLNNNVADGRDISWIWDVDFERCTGHLSMPTIAGSRARDLALRLKYAGIAQEEMLVVPPAPLRAARKEEPVTGQHYGLKAALDAAIERTPEGETLFVIPTYTGLLALHQELERRGLTARYWEGRDY